jgi:predicted alpha/beta superfamily hydrolase
MKLLKFFFLVLMFLVAGRGLAQTVDTITIPSKVFNKTRKIKVVLPDGYKDYPNTTNNYMVVYLFDSQSEDFFNFYKTTIDYLTKQGYLQPVILVGIASENRQFEFTPKAQTTAGLANFRKSGGADSLALHLKNEVMPVIFSKYRCYNYNVGIGHSLGGTFLINSLIAFPELFNAVIAISPNLQYDDEQIVNRFDSPDVAKSLNHKYLYIAHGSGDKYEDQFRIGSEKIHNMLIKKQITGLRWQFKNMDNDSHGTTPLEGVFKGLVDMERQFNMPNSQIEKLYNDKSKPFIESIKDYYVNASNWGGIKVPRVYIINNLAYNLYYQKRIKESIEVFKWGLTLYPDDVNLYDSIGEILQNTGDKKEAKSYYLKGVAVVKKQKAPLDQKTYNNLITGFNNRIKSLEIN